VAAQRADVMGDKRLRTLRDPGEVTDAQLVRSSNAASINRVGSDSARAFPAATSASRVQAAFLRSRSAIPQVEAEKLANDHQSYEHPNVRSDVRIREASTPDFFSWWPSSLPMTEHRPIMGVLDDVRRLLAVRADSKS